MWAPEPESTPATNTRTANVPTLSGSTRLVVTRPEASVVSAPTNSGVVTKELPKLGGERNNGSRQNTRHAHQPQ
jgi:hypothetical protein